MFTDLLGRDLLRLPRLENFPFRQSQVHKTCLRDAFVAPLGDSLRRNLAETGNLDGSAKLINQTGVGFVFHACHCNYSYHEKANHSFSVPCNHAYMESLDKRIQRLRESRGMSQQAVADKVGVSRVAVTKWESGMTANLKLGNLLSLCDLFGVSVEELVRGVGAAKPGVEREAAKAVAMESAWKAYSDASEATRAVVDLVLLPKEERDELEKQALLSIEILEERAAQLLRERKKTNVA
ncbi:MAG: helix-turn-helix transcriptional regulator [Porticoccaceae bacterium]